MKSTLKFSIVLLFISLKTIAQKEPSFSKSLSLNEFNYSKASIKINGKPATYDELIKASDTLYLKVEIYDKKSAEQLFGKEEGKKGAVLLTTKKFKPETHTIMVTDDSAKYYVENGDTIFLKATTSPIFGGDTSHIAWNKFLERNLNALTPAENGSPSGLYIVTVRFFINTNGSVSNISIDEDPGYGTGNEVLRLISKSHSWTPAIYHGKAVKSLQSQNIVFSVSGF